jgi:urease alpha subunit
VETGALTLSINETQLTSLLAARLDEQTDPFISNPQVYLRDGQIQVYGKAKRGDVEANVRIILSVTLDAQGKPVVTVASADFGPVPAPDGLNQTISAFVDEMLTGSLGPMATGLRLETINIADGVMTLTGKAQ